MKRVLVTIFAFLLNPLASATVIGLDGREYAVPTKTIPWNRGEYQATMNLKGNQSDVEWCALSPWGDSCDKALDLPPETKKLIPLFKNPLVLGASVSKDWSSTSPGKLLSRKLRTDFGLTTWAIPAADSEEVLRNLLDSILKDSTVVVAIDLFFWDSHNSSCAAAQAGVDSFLSKMKQSKLPVILGNIPPLKRAGPCRNALNQRIAESCTNSSQCRILDLTALFNEATSPQGIHYFGKQYHLKDLLAEDEIHPNGMGSLVLTRALVDLLLKI